MGAHKKKGRVVLMIRPLYSIQFFPFTPTILLHVFAVPYNARVLRVVSSTRFRSVQAALYIPSSGDSTSHSTLPIKLTTNSRTR